MAVFSESLTQCVGGRKRRAQRELERPEDGQMSTMRVESCVMCPVHSLPGHAFKRPSFPAVTASGFISLMQSDTDWKSMPSARHL